jgi:methylation protein EvaC
MKQQFIDLGLQPIANGFLRPNDHEWFFRIAAGYDPETHLVSLMHFVDSTMLFNDRYIYCSSGSATMRAHFEAVATRIKDMLPKLVLEIGSNDGVFLKHFPVEKAIAVEPCGNFASITTEMGYKTYPCFWNASTVDLILQNHPKADIVYAASCMCHIPKIEDAFALVRRVLAPEGIFIFEDPSVIHMLQRNSYDQIYDEHAHIFSLLALEKLLSQAGLMIFNVERLSVHGGSNRIYACHNHACVPLRLSARDQLEEERSAGLDKIETYLDFAQRVVYSKFALTELLRRLRSQGEKIIGYGATSKSTVVYNYCDIGPELLDCVIDTTPAKQGLLTPGTHIPIVAPEVGLKPDVTAAFLGAWNFADEIVSKERAFVARGGKFITHVPSVRVL